MAFDLVRQGLRLRRGFCSTAEQSLMTKDSAVQIASFQLLRCRLLFRRASSKTGAGMQELARRSRGMKLNGKDNDRRRQKMREPDRLYI
ncbi:MAG: hypothetical protein C4334_12845 [Pyrinomonas sp.]